MPQDPGKARMYHVDTLLPDLILRRIDKRPDSRVSPTIEDRT
jgi:hypothetical protein